MFVGPKLWKLDFIEICISLLLSWLTTAIRDKKKSSKVFKKPNEIFLWIAKKLILILSSVAPSVTGACKKSKEIIFESNVIMKWTCIPWKY